VLLVAFCQPFRCKLAAEEGVASGRAKLDPMSETTATRTLVKSPPELWAECSDASSLSRHLPEFGEIKITKLDPETAVAWEGERISGTVRIEPSGWGTRVTLTAKPEVVAEEEPVVAEPEPVVAEPELHVVEPEPEPEPVVVTPPAPAHRGGLFARLLERVGLRGVPAPQVEFAPAEPAEPEPVADAQEALAPEIEPAEPVAQAPSPAAELAELESTLTAALDSLGQAHHRPFSRP
jgi:hypothetical protein